MASTPPAVRADIRTDVRPDVRTDLRNDIRIDVLSPAATQVSVKSMLRTVERVLLRDGGQRTALYNARAAVLEGEARSAARAEAHASLQRLASLAE